jgi:O-acetyl-ADP-ribose deacetylase (regulator of RNase III)
VTVSLVKADITTLEADAIVNAANARLAGGGGVDGAIHAAGGPSILEECRRIGSCAPGSAVITGAGRLRARYVIHAVAPIYTQAPHDAFTLHGAYAAALRLAHEHELRSIVFPSLGTGAYAYPIDEAARIALRTVLDHLERETSLERVTFALFSQADLATYAATLRAFSSPQRSDS